MDTNYFARLNQINVSEHIERKNGFAYLSWPYAVQQLRLADPTAFWEVRRFTRRCTARRVCVRGTCLSRSMSMHARCGSPASTGSSKAPM